MQEIGLSNDYGISTRYEQLLQALPGDISGLHDYTQYQDDPVGFCEDVLGETLTDDIKRMMESVRDYPITIAKSATGPGKTFAAARIAAWWNKCFPDSQTYTAAAPPEGNLKRLLWGEINSILRAHPQLFQHQSLCLG